ncbi:hypothetical protein HNY73_000472 [Argiope bruennichi]|uniref:Uncharacterized protein n=1 Tax=Argiope bruennichi TaxID=94029 RepID=A0A8T0G0K3_ARGBR|nr:hypothetical protein HNY73_000472 [Argiope bruennichi]
MYEDERSLEDRHGNLGCYFKLSQRNPLLFSLPKLNGSYVLMTFQGDKNACRCREWFAPFKSDNTSLKDKPGRGRPLDLNGQHFGSHERGQKLENSNVGQQLQCGPFNNRSSSQKLEK